MPPARVLDATALVELFRGHTGLYDLLDEAASGQVVIGIPAVCIAEAEAVLKAGSGWDAIFATPRVRSIPLDENAAVEIGSWPGALAVRQAVREARLLNATVVTASAEAYRNLNVPLWLV